MPIFHKTARISPMPCKTCRPAKRVNPAMRTQIVKGEAPKPSWLKLKVSLPNERYKTTRLRAQGSHIATVCKEAMCPNINECWGAGTATFMVMGDTCTRACKFCNVNHGKPAPLDPQEPEKLAAAIGELGLDYAVITCVDRDDLPDLGASHLAACISALRKAHPKIAVEVLSSDFQGKTELVKKVVDASPHVFGHNIETVKRLQSSVRDTRANYEQSLAVLKFVKKSRPDIFTKSSIMVGLGEKQEEVVETIKDLRAAKVDFFTIGQYLRPSAWNLKVEEYIKPELFTWYKEKGLELGFKHVASGPFVRSSYKAGEAFIKNFTKTL